MTTNNTFKGVDVRQTGNQLVFRAGLLDSSSAIVTSGTTTLRLAELQSDGTFKTYDFTSNTFKTSSMTSGGQTAAMTHRQWLTYSAGDANLDTGLWTYSLGTLSGFTVGAMYIALVTNTGASPNVQWREFQYGGAQGDLVVTAIGTGTASVQSDLQTIKGQAVTATGGFSFDAQTTEQTNVAALVTRITSTLFTGITSLAQWLGAMAGKQVANTTAITEIQATGAGSGTFTAPNNSLQAIRDRGDAAWVTATGFAMTDVIVTGTASAATSTTLTLAAALGADDLPVGAKLRITSGTGAKQTRVVTGYVNSTKVVTVDRAFTVTPDNTSVYALIYDDAPALNGSLAIAGYRCNFEAAFTDSSGTAKLRVEAWLEDQNNGPVAQTAGATCEVTLRELGTDILALDLAPVLDTTTGTFYIEQSTPNLTADRGYVVEVTIIDAASVTHGPSIYSNVTFG